jgi:uncharacterized protein
MTSPHKARWLRPDFCFDRPAQITPAWLAGLGVRGVLLDIDNTITRWEKLYVPPADMAWLEGLRTAGIKVLLLSNGLPRKVASVVAQTGVAHVSGRPMKPLAFTFRRGLKELGLAPAETAIIGDSIFTDIIMPNRLGIWTCLVEPRSDVDFLGSKLYRWGEHLLRLRKPMLAAHDLRAVGVVTGQP